MTDAGGDGGGADPLDRVWAYFDAPDPVVSAAEAGCWPPGALDALVGLGLLAPAAPAAEAPCPSCPDRHVEAVELARRPDGSAVYRMPCPEGVYADVDPADLRRWAPDFKALARRLKEALGLVGRATEHVPGRLWRLGAGRWNGRPREAFLARGLAWADGRAVAGRLPGDARPVVFVGYAVPPPGLWPAAAPPLVRLPTVLGTGGGRVALDLELVAWWVAAADAAAAAAGDLAEADLGRRVGRMIERRFNEGSAADLVVGLSNMGLSGRDAAAEMKRRGVPMSHATFCRKKKRLAGGPAGSSRSVLRDPSSQPRDKRGRPIADAQPEKPE